MFEKLQQLLPILAPVIVIELILVATALIDLRKQTTTRGSKWMWAAFICFISIIGPTAYFMLGRKEE